MKYRISAGIFVFNYSIGLEGPYYWFYFGSQRLLFSSFFWPNKKITKEKTQKNDESQLL
jgi:hypothetical protein